MELSPSMQLTQLGCLPRSTASRFWSLATPGWCAYLSWRQCFQKPGPRSWEEGVPWQGRKEHLPLRWVNCCLGLHGLPPPAFCQRDPGPETSPPHPPPPDSLRREAALSADGPRPRSCFTCCDPTLYSLPPSPPPTLSASPQEKKARGNSHLLVVE